MQRKNNFLKTFTKKNRAGMAMIMAIAVIVVLTTIMALSLSLTTQTAKRTTDIYLYEQSALYAKSAAELALLSIAQNGCQNALNFQFNGIYNANVTMRYVYTGNSGCSEYIGPATGGYILTPQQNGSVLMDITVTTIAGRDPITYFRRTIQKL